MYCLILFILFRGIIPVLTFQDSGYENIFGRDYKEALEYLETNPWILDSLSSRGVDPCGALSVVFPELIRYSSLRDKAETLSLQSLYQKYGHKYSDFSIGHFQMKPSFAEDLEKNVLRSKTEYEKPVYEYDTSDTEDARRSRLKRLTSPEGQVTYLADFMNVMKNKAEMIWKDNDSLKVRYLATAYNCGFYRDSSVIWLKMEEKNFYTGWIVPETLFNYSLISLEYYYSFCR